MIGGPPPSANPGEINRSPIRIAVVEDHVLICDALAAVLRSRGHEVLVPSLTSGPEMEAQLAAFHPHVLLLDLDLGSAGCGQRLIGPLSQAGTRVLIVSATPDEAQVGEAIWLGAVGWVPKHGSFDQLLEAVRIASSGGSLIDPGQRDRLVGLWRQRQTESEASLRPFETLTKREAAVLAALMDGRSVERIAAESYVSVSTVRSQVRAVLCKLGVRSQLEAVALAIRTRWSPNPDALAAVSA